MSVNKRVFSREAAKTYDRNVKNFESATVSKNLTYEISTVPVKVRLHFIIIDENGVEKEIEVENCYNSKQMFTYCIHKCL